MDKKMIADGRLAFKLYNKMYASNNDIRDAKKLLKDLDVEQLDVYGKFVWAQVLLFRVYIRSKNRAHEAFEMFVKITQSPDTPKKLLVGAYYHIGLAYERGYGVECNRNHALENYLEANKLNNKVCLSDIARVTKALHPTKPETAKGTPEEYRYKFYVGESDDELEKHIGEAYQIQGAGNADHRRRMKTLKRTGFYYEDEPEIINLADLDLYCVDGVTPDDLIRKKKKPMRLDEYDEYGYSGDGVDDYLPESLFYGLDDDIDIDDWLDGEDWLDGFDDDDDDD